MKQTNGPILPPILLCSLLLSSGCSFTPDFHPPEVINQNEWGNRALMTSQNPASRSESWWQTFNSPQLSSLITEALAKNAELQGGLHRITAARAEARIAGAPLLPAISYSGDIRQNSATGGASGQGSQGSPSDTIVGQVGLSYELDIWGRIRASRGGALALVDASEFDYLTLTLLISTDTAQAFFSGMLLGERVAVTRELVKALSETLELVALKERLGALSGFEVAQQRVLVQDATATLQLLERQQRGAQHQLAVLLGITPQELLSRAPIAFEEITAPTVSPTLPSEVVAFRPDILREEARIKSADFDIGVARAAYFPRISLGVSGAFSSTGLSGPWQRSSTFSEALLGPIFQGGAIQGAVERAEANQREALERYRQTVLTAFREVEDSIVAVDTGLNRWRALQVAEESAKMAFDIAQQRFRAGGIDFQAFLDAQRSLLSVRNNAIQAKLEYLGSVIALNRAIGARVDGPKVEGAGLTKKEERNE